MRITFYVLLSIITINVQAQITHNPIFTNSKKHLVEWDKIESWFAYVPASTYHTQDDQIVTVKGYYMMRYEMPNVLYRFFINDLKSKNKTDELLSSLPDTNAWGGGTGLLKPFVDQYFSNPRLGDYPVVQVPRKGIELFCEWLNEKVKSLKLKKWKGKKIIFRLPTEVEWMVAASGGDTNAVYAWKGPFTRTMEKGFEGDFMANFARVGDGDVFRDENGKLVIKANKNKKYRNYFPMHSDNADITAPVLCYWPNAYGIFCMTGNVREMVQEEGFSKGGSWIDPGGECMIDFRNTYQKEGFPCEGFRLVVEVE